MGSLASFLCLINSQKEVIMKKDYGAPDKYGIANCVPEIGNCTLTNPFIEDNHNSFFEFDDHDFKRLFVEMGETYYDVRLYFRAIDLYNRVIILFDKNEDAFELSEYNFLYSNFAMSYFS